MMGMMDDDKQPAPWPAGDEPLLVGELNPYQLSEQSEYALYPYPEQSAGGRLCRLVMGIPPHRYIRWYARANLCSGKWSTPAARRRAAELGAQHERAVAVVLLGSKVCTAHDLGFRPFTRTGRFVILPHPSGLSRAWSESDAFERARGVLREAGVLP